MTTYIGECHELKCALPYFHSVACGEKRFEIRLDDRNYKVGDVLYLREWDDEYTGAFVFAKVTCITDFQQKPGYVVMSIEVLS